jgi:hypothetical protein
VYLKRKDARGRRGAKEEIAVANLSFLHRKEKKEPPGYLKSYEGLCWEV